MVCRIAATIRNTVRDILIQSHRRDYLRKRIKSRTAAVVPSGEAVLGKVIEELTKSWMNSQQENNAKLSEVLALRTAPLQKREHTIEWGRMAKHTFNARPSVEIVVSDVTKMDRIAG